MGARVRTSDLGREEKPVGWHRRGGAGCFRAAHGRRARPAPPRYAGKSGPAWKTDDGGQRPADNDRAHLAWCA